MSLYLPHYKRQFHRHLLSIFLQRFCNRNINSKRKLDLFYSYMKHSGAFQLVAVTLEYLSKQFYGYIHLQGEVVEVKMKGISSLSDPMHPLYATMSL